MPLQHVRLGAGRVTLCAEWPGPGVPVAVRWGSSAICRPSDPNLHEMCAAVLVTFDLTEEALAPSVAVLHPRLAGE